MTTAPIDPALASDGIDELPSCFLSAAADAQPVGGSVHIHCDDVAGEWTLRPAGDGFDVTSEHATGDCALRGTASDLLLVLWRRRPMSTIDGVGEADGDAQRWLRWPDVCRLVRSKDAATASPPRISERMNKDSMTSPSTRRITSDTRNAAALTRRRFPRVGLVSAPSNAGNVRNQEAIRRSTPRHSRRLQSPDTHMRLPEVVPSDGGVYSARPTGDPSMIWSRYSLRP
jgi:hypothetical protein